MRSFKSKRLGKCLLATAFWFMVADAAPSWAQDAIESCTETNIALTPPSNLRLARVAGHSRAYLLSEEKGCSRGGQACRTGQYLLPGDVVVVGGREAAGRLCVARPGRSAADGWADSSRFQPIQPPASPGLRVWAGTWMEGDKSITVSVAGDRLRASGNAYWPRHNAPNGHMGSFTGETKPDGIEALFTDEGEEDCKVKLALLGPMLVVSDNLKCGGFNVSFRGIYIRR